jgi:hypothetical protein
MVSSIFKAFIQKNIVQTLLFFIIIFLVPFSLNAQTTKTIKAGAFIVDMGVLPQTVANGLKPYGMIYDLMKNYQVPILWSINPSKAKDGIDFTIGTKNFSGGPFIIEKDFITTDVASRITYWQTQGVVGVTTAAPLTVPVGTTLYKAPNWTLDKQNGLVAIPYFTNAGIPSTAYGGATSATWKNPADLTGCDDLFVMPHADPAWITHGNLLNWNQTYKGGIWLGCSAGSHLEDMFDNVTPDVTKQTNFLSEKTGNASGAGPYYQNALIDAKNHTGGKSPYTYDPTLQGEPVMQFMGIFDAAVASGAETVYIPLAPGWRTTTKVGVYDSDHTQKIDALDKHRAAIIAWGPAFGNTSNGKVFIEASHSFNGTGPTNVAAQRVFFNFSFTSTVGVVGKEVIPVISGLPAGTVLFSGQSLDLSLTLPTGVDLVRDGYTVQWTSSGGGAFSPNATSQNVSFTAPSNLGIAQLKVTLTDGCARATFDSKPVDIQCLMSVSPVAKDICNGAASNSGQITVNVSNGSGPFVWNYSQTSGGSATGSGTSVGTVNGSIISFPITGLTAGTYSVTVKGSNGTGCISNFTSTVSALPAFSVATSSSNNISVNGGTDGSVNVTVTGGTPAYSYNWSNGASTQNLSSVASGTYSLTVTDSKNCVASLPSSVTLSQPPAISITPTVTNVLCNGQSNGAISISVSGGATPYTYLWNDGVSTQNRTGLKAGTYTVTLTDANGAVRTSSSTVSQPTAVLSATTSSTNLLCSTSAANGTISLTVAGGTTAYTYAWTKTGAGAYSATTQNISSLDIGTYNVTVTDANGCTVATSANITKPSALSVSGTIVNPSCPVDASIIANRSDGSINISVTGGTSPYSYSWSDNPSTSSTRTGLSVGSFSVTVTDANSCTATFSKTLVATNPNPVNPSSIKH